MTIRRWNFKTHEYEPFEIPDGRKVMMYSDDMSAKCSCAACGKELPFGDTFTSRILHGAAGFGYGVCFDCYQREIDEEFAAKEDEDAEGENG